MRTCTTTTPATIMPLKARRSNGAPQSYGMSGTTNDGEMIWQKLKGDANLKFVFSGHVLNDSTGYQASVGNQGNVVNQLLANYQLLTNGGNGYMRLLEFLPDGQTVHVRSYSPYLDSSFTGSDQDFTISMTSLPAVMHTALGANCGLRNDRSHR